MHGGDASLATRARTIPVRTQTILTRATPPGVSFRISDRAATPCAFVAYPPFRREFSLCYSSTCWISFCWLTCLLCIPLWSIVGFSKHHHGSDLSLPSLHPLETRVSGFRPYHLFAFHVLGFIPGSGPLRPRQVSGVVVPVARSCIQVSASSMHKSYFRVRILCGANPLCTILSRSCANRFRAQQCRNPCCPPVSEARQSTLRESAGTVRILVTKIHGQSAGGSCGETTFSVVISVRSRFASRFPEGSVADDRGRHRLPQHSGKLSIGHSKGSPSFNDAVSMVAQALCRDDVIGIGVQGSCLAQGAKFHVAGSSPGSICLLSLI